MCQGQKENFVCPLREKCYRFTAKPTPKYQSQFMSIPYDENKKICGQYWETNLRNVL